MRRAAVCLGILLALGCDVEKTRETGTQAGTVPEPASSTAHAPTLESFATPWTPRNEAASFFSRPAESWDKNRLELTDYTLDVSVASGLATATLSVSVRNPTAGQAEAVIDLPIPPGAAVTDATLWVGEKPMVGVMLSSAKAREVYDKIVNRRRDPLLVAWKSADMLSLSIFPLEAEQTRRLKITWVEPAPTDKQWVPSFHDKEELVGFPNKIAVNGKTVDRNGDWVDIPRTVAAPTGNFRLQTQHTLAPSAVALVVDTSGENAAERGHQWNEIESFLNAFAGRSTVSIVAADWLAIEIGAGTKTADFAAGRERFMNIRSAGLFDQRQALDKAHKIVGPKGVVAFISGGSPTNLGNEPVAAPVYWVHKVLHGQGGIVGRSGGRWVKSGAALAKNVRALVPPTTGGFDWLPLESATGHVVWLGHKKGTKTDPRAKASPVEALFYRAMLHRAEIPPNKIVSPQTSILVLESEEHYKRWGIKDDKGQLVDKSGKEPPTIDALLKRGIVESQGWGFGVSGVGAGGGGTGWGTIGMGRYGTIGHGGGTGAGYGSSRPPGRPGSPARVRIGAVTADGDLDKHIIRRYIRRKLARVRNCYEKELLLRDEDIAGTATAVFTISPEGMVVAPRVSIGHANGKRTSECINKTIASIKFPKPKGGGLVKVRIPFALSPGARSLWRKANKLVKAAKPGLTLRVGKLFGYKGPADPNKLGWWLAENHLRHHRAPADAYLVVATLLRSGEPRTPQAETDATRILSEAARRYPDVIAETFKEWGQGADAERVENLAEGSRGSAR